MPSAEITDYILPPRSYIYIYVLIPNPLPSAVALRIELLWAVSSRRPPHSFTCTLPRAHHSSQAASAADARADAAARAAVSAVVVELLFVLVLRSKLPFVLQ